MTLPGKPGDRPDKRKGPDAVALTTEQLEEILTDLETRLERLRALYDMYFMGIERLEPMTQKKDVERRLYALRKEQIRNTGVRFRFNMLVQRYNTLQTYWMRIARAIEEGRYRRDVLRARNRQQEARQKRREREEKLGQDVPTVDDGDVVEIESEEEPRRPEVLSMPPTPIAVERQEAAAPSARAATSGLVFHRPRTESAMAIPVVRVPTPAAEDDLSESRLREIHDRYLAVRKQCNESIHNVSFERMSMTLRNMVPGLKRKAGGRKVDFEVTIKDGKAFLKPVAR